MSNFLTRRVPPRLIHIIATVALFIFMPLLLYGTYQTAVLMSRATGVRASIVVDASVPLEPIQTDFYHAFAQGGEETHDMLKPVIDQITPLSPRVIRIDHIYDYYDVVDRNNGQLTFDFTRLDGAVDSILATGADPILVLSYMPRVIAQDSVITNPPTNWNDWQHVVSRTIQHYSGREQRNLTNVTYEVWNEPDLEQFGSWHYGGEKNYLDLYRHAALGAAQTTNTNTFRIGGPATTGLYKNWIEAMVTLAQQGVRLDFVSWHTYEEDPFQFQQDQQALTQWLLPYPEYVLLPRLITEFGFTGDRDPRYNTPYAAAHTAAVIRQLISGGPASLVSFQLKDGPGQEAFGWGLVTHEDNGAQPKPRYHVYSFIDRMRGTRIHLSGEGTWVTGLASRDDATETLRILLVNFDTLERHSETVPVTIRNLTPGSYTYRERFLGGRDVVFEETVSEEGLLVRDVFMPENSIAILEVVKQQ